MSWQDYVDNQLVGAGLVAVVIIGLDGEVRAQNNIAVILFFTIEF